MRHIYALGLIGAVTGLISWVVFFADVEILADFLGAIFGVGVAAYLFRTTATAPLRLALVVIGFGLSWQIAFEFAGTYYERIGSMTLTGMIAGAIGAAIVAAAVATTNASYRKAIPVLRTLCLGAGFGAFLGWETNLGAACLFIGWQTAIGASLGWRDQAIQA